MQGVKVNVSEQESKAGDRFVLPSGKYKCIITDCEPKLSKSDANPGGKMLYFTFTVQEGPYADRNTWANACLWSGALYTIINLLKAIGEYDNLIDGKELTIPELPEFYIGKELIVRRGVNQKSKEKNPDDDPENWIEVRGFASAKNAAVGSSSSAASGPKSSNSLLP